MKAFPARIEYQDEWIKEFIIQTTAEMLSNNKISVRSCKMLVNLPLEVKRRVILESMHKVREFQQLQASLTTVYSVDNIARGFARDGKKRKILICSPHRNEEHLMWWRENCLLKLVGPHGYDITSVEPTGLDIDTGKGVGADRAKDEDYDYLFLWDDDVVPTNRIFLHDLLANEVDVVCGVYYKKIEGVKESVCMTIDEHGKAVSVGEELMGLIPAYICSGGFTLIKTEVFKKLEAPYFKTVKVEEHLQMNEDAYFTKKLENIGITTYIDTHVRAKHYDRGTGKYF